MGLIVYLQHPRAKRFKSTAIVTTVDQGKRMPYVDKNNVATLSTSATDVVHASATTVDISPEAVSNSASI
jgi:hypothetical protein